MTIKQGYAAAALLGSVLAVGAQFGMAHAQTEPSATARARTLPGGASALSETHGDWTVNCRVTNNLKLCGMSHQQFNTTNNQRLLAIELTATTDQNAIGTLALPFGLALAKGIAFKIDDKKLEGTLQFSTCQAVGCLVPVTFDARMIEALKAGTTLKIEGVASDTGQPIEFSVSLNGFSSALSRTGQLSAD